jgi:hypothetical protein
VRIVAEPSLNSNDIFLRERGGYMFTKLLVGAVAAGTMSVPLAGLAWADVSVSVGGVTAYDDGGPSTAATSGLNFAYASNNSEAVAWGPGFGNLAIATNNSDAAAGAYLIVPGSLNTAIADNDSSAYSLAGIGSTAIARDGSKAEAVGIQSFNFVRATNNSYAAAAAGGFNSVTASDNSTATTDRYGSANLITARCGGSVTLSAQSNQIVMSAPCETG